MKLKTDMNAKEPKKNKKNLVIGCIVSYLIYIHIVDINIYNVVKEF